MNSLKLGWIFPGIVLSVLIIVVGVGIYQLNSDGNPWNRKKPDYNHDFLGSIPMEPKDERSMNNTDKIVDICIPVIKK